MSERPYYFVHGRIFVTISAGKLEMIDTGQVLRYVMEDSKMTTFELGGGGRRVRIENERVKLLKESKTLVEG